MRTLNKIGNNSQEICLEYCQKLLTEIETPLIGAEFGSAYGGGVESIGKLWKDRGIVYGFDTFSGHPKQLAADSKSKEATCMDDWYRKFPNEELSYEYQRAELDKQGLDNVILKKGLINENSCADIPYLNYVLLDLDILASMKIGYELVKDKITKDGYLFFHDVVPHKHLPLLHKWFFDEVMSTGLWEIIYKGVKFNHLVGIRKKQPLKALFYPNVPFDSLYIPWIYKEIYLDKVYADIFNKNRDMVIVDVGANIGIVTQFMRNYAKKVYAIEPATEHFEALAKNKEFNCWDNVEIFRIAIADRDGEMTLHKNNKNRTMHSLTTSCKQGGELVETMTMDTFFSKNNINSVDFMKFDVEGAEDLILRSEGFKKVASKIKAIEVEIHSKSRDKLVSYMVEIGYQVKRYLKSGIIVLLTRD